MLRSKYIFTIIFYVLVFLFFCHSFCTAERDKMTFEECMNFFNIDKIDFQRSNAARKNSHNLGEYFLCMAAHENNSGTCYNLVNPQECLRQFNQFWAFFARLIIEGRLDPQMINACKQAAVSKEDANNCERIGRVILTGDESLLKDVKDRNQIYFLKAISTLDLNQCRNEDCKNIVYFLKAVKTADIKMCDKITRSEIRWLCKGGLSSDNLICQQNKRFNAFKKDYCSY